MNICMFEPVKPKTRTPEGVAYTLVRKSDPKSSHKAAEKVVSSGLVKSHEDKLLYWLKKCPGSTTKEIGDMSYGKEHHIKHVEAGKRTKRLKDNLTIWADDTAKLDGCAPLWLWDDRPKPPGNNTTKPRK